MADSPAVAIKLPNPPDYGAVEVKAFIPKATWRGFIITGVAILVIVLLYLTFMKISEARANALKLAPIVRLKLDNLPPPPTDAEDVPPPPAETIVNNGPASRAGTPVPVPETEITADMKEFASMEELGRASSVGGDGIDLGGMASNIDIDRQNKVDVQVKEEEPGAYDFVAVEKEPYIDLNELQRKIVYPEMARKAGVEGTVLIRVLVEKDGRPKKTIIEQSDSELLNEAARGAVMKSVFTPAIQNDRPVALWVTIPIIFKLK